MGDSHMLPPVPMPRANPRDFATERLKVGFQVIGFDWRYLWINAAAAAHGRREPHELVGQTMMAMYPGIENTPMFRALKQCMDDGQPVKLQNLFTFPDGDTRWFEVRVEPSPEGINIFSFDIHERRLAELAAEAERAEWAAISWPRRVWRTLLGATRSRTLI
jgi:hypothetical protein